MAKPGLVYGTMGRIEPLLEPSILPRFLDLDQDGKILAEYVWLGGSGADLLQDEGAQQGGQEREGPANLELRWLQHWPGTWCGLQYHL